MLECRVWLAAGTGSLFDGMAMFIASPEGLEEPLAVGGTKLDRGGLCITGEGFCADFFTMRSGCVGSRT